MNISIGPYMLWTIVAIFSVAVTFGWWIIGMLLIGAVIQAKS